MADERAVQATIVLPTYNEAENIPVIVPRIFDVLEAAGIDGEVVVVDDNSPDGTAGVARDLAETFAVRVLCRMDERGLATAVLSGFAAADGEVCVVMDADMSHPIEKLPEMIRPLLDGEADITVGSRYIAGGGCDSWPLHRKIVSRAAGALALGFTKLSDPTTGFMAVSRTVIENNTFSPVGWKIVLEVVTRADARVQEVPIVFADRLHGESKLTGQVQLDYLRHLWQLYDFKVPTVNEFIKFCLVGLSGLFVDTALLLIAAELFGLDPRLAAIIAFSGAVTSNYVLDRAWTFKFGLGFGPGRRYGSFVLICLVGLGLRVLVMHALIENTFMGSGRWYILASMIGIVLSTIFNFVGSKTLAFRR